MGIQVVTPDHPDGVGVTRLPTTNDLFAYVECESEAVWSAIAATDVCRRWWRFMREMMPVNADDSPVCRDLREVFHLERRFEHNR